MKLNLSLLSIFSLVYGTHAFAGLQKTNVETSTGVSRRESFAKVATIVGGVTAGLTTSFPNVANATPTDETPRVVTRMGGLLVSF